MVFRESEKNESLGFSLSSYVSHLAIFDYWTFDISINGNSQGSGINSRSP